MIPNNFFWEHHGFQILSIKNFWSICSSSFLGESQFRIKLAAEITGECKEIFLGVLCSSAGTDHPECGFSALGACETWLGKELSVFSLRVFVGLETSRGPFQPMLPWCCDWKSASFHLYLFIFELRLLHLCFPMEWSPEIIAIPTVSRGIKKKKKKTWMFQTRVCFGTQFPESNCDASSLLYSLFSWTATNKLLSWTIPVIIFNTALQKDYY